MDWLPVTSPQNSRVKEARQLASRRGRRKTGRFLLEGPWFIEEALHAGAPVDYLLVDRQARDDFPQVAELAAGKGVTLCELAPGLVAELAGTENTLGWLAIGDQPEPFNPLHVDRKGAPLLVALDAVSDPGNCGTIIRTAAALGASGVLGLPGTCDFYNLKALRATAGAVFHLPCDSFDSAVLLDLVNAGWRIVAADTPGAAGESLPQFRFGGPTVLVLGNEAHGLSQQASALVQERVTIPHKRPVDSLNVAAAAAMVIYEWARQQLP